MTIFRCARCDNPVTPDLRRRRLPALDWPDLTRSFDYAPLMRPGDFAVDPRPFGRFATPGTIVTNPEDLRGVRRHSDWARVSGCCGPVGDAGPTLMCDRCGLDVATERVDCWMVPAVHLEPGAVTVWDGASRRVRPALEVHFAPRRRSRVRR